MSRENRLIKEMRNEVDGWPVCLFKGPDTWAEIAKRKRPDGYNLNSVFFLSFILFVFWPSPLTTAGAC